MISHAGVFAKESSKARVDSKPRQSLVELLYKADLPEFTGEPMWALFDTDIVEQRYLSEDYYFCKLWRDAGHEVYCFVPAEFKHWGITGCTGHILDAWKMREHLQAAAE